MSHPLRNNRQIALNLYDFLIPDAKEPSFEYQQAMDICRNLQPRSKPIAIRCDSCGAKSWTDNQCTYCGSDR